MNSLALLLPLLCLASIVNCDVYEDCGTQFTTTVGCMFKGLKEIAEASPKAKIDGEAMKNDLFKCFPDSGCANLDKYKEDKMEMGPDAEQLIERLQGVTGALGINPSRLKKIIGVGMECAKGMQGKVKPEITKCVQETNPNLAKFELPKLPAEIAEKMKHTMLVCNPKALIAKKLHHMVQQHMEGMMGMKRLAWASTHPGLCPTPEALTKVKTCIMAVETKHLPKEITCMSPMTSMLGFLDMRDNMCKKKDECLKDMSETCMALGKEVPKVVCTCASSYLDDNWSELVADMMTCINAKLAEPVKLPAAMVNGPFKSMAKRLLSKQCGKIGAMEDRPDPCSPDFNPFEMVDMMKAMKMGKGKGKGLSGKGKGKGLSGKGKGKGKGVGKGKGEGKGTGKGAMKPAIELLEDGPPMVIAETAPAME